MFVLALLAILLLAAGTALSYYVDALWFGSLGYGDVFWKTLRLQSAIFTGLRCSMLLTAATPVSSDIAPAREPARCFNGSGMSGLKIMSFNLLKSDG